MALALASVAACVDGRTPNCADAAAGCGYDTDGALVVVEGGSDAEAGVRDASEGGAVPDAGQDAGQDAPVDTGADVTDANAG